MIDGAEIMAGAYGTLKDTFFIGIVIALLALCLRLDCGQIHCDPDSAFGGDSLGSFSG